MSKQDFAGFPLATFQFFSQLAENNNREWFQANKATYVSEVVEPAKQFVRAVGERLQVISDGIRYDTRSNGSGSMMRIYRDIRFAKDKTPYRTGLGIVFWEGSGKKSECPGFYFGLDATGAGAHAGLHGFTRPFLAAYREAVVDEPRGAALEAALAAVHHAGPYTLSDKNYKRVPRGYAADHPRAGLLLYSGIYASGPTIDTAVASSPELVDICLRQFQDMAPLQQWLVTVAEMVAD